MGPFQIYSAILILVPYLFTQVTSELFIARTPNSKLFHLRVADIFRAFERRDKPVPEQKKISAPQSFQRAGPLKSTVELGFLDPSRSVQSNRYTAIESELLCTICHNILWKPVACFTCENAFCTNCIQTWISKQRLCREVTCPFHCLFQEKRAPPILNNLLSKLRISCAYAPNGCREILPYDTLEKHEETCQHERTPCQICRTPVSNRDRDNQHDLKQCFQQTYDRDRSQVQTQFLKLLEVVEASQKRIKALEDLLDVQRPESQ